MKIGIKQWALVAKVAKYPLRYLVLHIYESRKKAIAAMNRYVLIRDKLRIVPGHFRYEERDLKEISIANV